jgi:signal transduction histidine kinase
VVDETAHVVIEADRHRLNQAMMNLIRNAAEHSPPGGRVRIGSKVDWRGSIRMWVRDHGESIPVEERERIFERFSRVGADRRKTEGAGLGLAIVTAIAEGHGGRVELTTPAGGGNVFTIVIPAQDRVS